MDRRTERALRRGVNDSRTISRYRAKVWPEPCLHGDRLWIGAIAGSGHGRFWLRDDAGKDVAIVAHRFGWALAHGVNSLLASPAIRHMCDEPLCQEPSHWIAGTVQENTLEWIARRSIPGSPLRDTRGAKGRALALRQALLEDHDVELAAAAGRPVSDLLQPSLFDSTEDTHT